MLTAEQLRAMLDYNSDSGIFRWKIAPNGRVPVGSIAGTVVKSGHRKITIDGRYYLAHRLAWLYVHGVWPASRLDHRDTDPGNDRIGNLREATQSQNQANRGANKNNRCGLKGASLHRKTGKYQARIHMGGKTHYLGLFATAEEANAAYANAAARLFGDFGRA